MSEEEDRCAEPDKISVNADPGRASLSNQMDDLGHIANKAERDASKSQKRRGVEVHDETAGCRPHHGSFSMVMLNSPSATPCDGGSRYRVARYAGRACGLSCVNCCITTAGVALSLLRFRLPASLTL